MRVQITGFEPETDFSIQLWAYESYKGNVSVIGLKIPQNAENFPGFCGAMEAEEQRITGLL